MQRLEDESDFPPWHCPISGARLVPDYDVLVSPDGRRYPVVDDIPRFVSGPTYADAFGTQWNHYLKTQLDSYSRTSVTRDRLRRCLGEELWSSLRGMHVLECGCGAGRFTEILLDGGALVTSIDLSTAVVANASNFPVGARHQVAQADLLRLPFAPEQFDVVLCLGVIQHTPSPERTIQALFSHVRPGGHIVIDHYRRNFGWYLSVKPLIRQVLKRLPAGTALGITAGLVDIFLPLHRATYQSRTANILLSRLSPLVHYYGVYSDFSDDVHREWAMLDTHDALTDWYKHRRTEAQIRAALAGAGAENIWCEAGGIGVEARARRSPAVKRTR